MPYSLWFDFIRDISNNIQYGLLMSYQNITSTPPVVNSWYGEWGWTRLTSLKYNSVVLLREMFLSHFYDLREVEHGDGGGRVRLRHLTGQSTGASWEWFRQNNVGMWTALCLVWKNKGGSDWWSQKGCISAIQSVCEHSFTYWSHFI